MVHLPYQDRDQAANHLAELLSGYAGREDVVVLGLPRGGVPVAFGIAEALDVPLDVMLVRKLGFPGREELAMGALASGGARVLNPEVVSYAAREDLDAVTRREREELRRRERAYRGDRPPLTLEDRCVILVDDGLATGATMRAAVEATRQLRPRWVIVAVPVAPPETAALLGEEADELVCPATPEPFMGVGRWYVDFSQTTDDEVRALLERSWTRERASRR